jgi:hypothetical protein
MLTSNVQALVTFATGNLTAFAVLYTLGTLASIARFALSLQASDSQHVLTWL